MRGIIKLALIGTSLALTVALLFMTIGKLLALPGECIAWLADEAGTRIIRLGDELERK
jgi:hypothetical protein